MISFLAERMTFDKLFRVSDPKRVTRSFTVKGPPLEIDSYQDSIYYAYNFKAQPSTTGLRHRGYVKFFKPRHGGGAPDVEGQGGRNHQHSTSAPLRSQPW